MLHFRIDWRFLVLAAVFLPVTISAGFWQLGRADYKESLQDTYLSAQAVPPLGCDDIAEGDGRWRRGRIEGRFEGGRQILVDNRTHQGKAGYQVITPFRCADGTLALVDRGWIRIPEGLRDRAPELTVPDGAVTLFGSWVERVPENPATLEAPFEQTWPRRILHWDAAAVGAALGGAHRLWFVLEDGQPGALVAAFPERDFKIDTHLGYAFQWFAISLGIVIWFLFTAIRWQRSDPQQDEQGNG